MGALLGLMCGLGLLFVVTGRRTAGARPGRLAGLRARTADLLGQAGYHDVGPSQLYVLCLTSGSVAFVLVAGVSRAPDIALAFGAFAGYAPVALVRRRSAGRRTELRSLWPDAVDNLGSAVRAGMSLPDAIAQLALRGPAPLRPAFAAFAADHRATGRFGDCLDRLKNTLADPVADRVIEALRIAREVGGSDLGRLLRTLSQFLREQARTRAELETRQGWTVGAARLALAAPWLVLGMLALRPATVAAYDSAGGLAVLVVGGAVSVAAYRVMLRIARLPDEPRVLR